MENLKETLPIIAYILAIFTYILMIVFYLPKYYSENKQLIHIFSIVLLIIITFILSYVYLNHRKSLTEIKKLLDVKETAFVEQASTLEESEARIEAMQEREKKSKFLIIKAQLYLLIYLLAEDNLLDYKSLKCTFHVQSSRNDKEYFQAFDYLPDGKGGGRTKSLDKGIVGKTFKEKKSLVENFQSDEEHNKKMIAEYNFRSDEIQNTNNRTNSYFTYPILDDYKVLGVIYLESKRVNTFTSDKSTHLMKKIYAACYGIGKKYPWDE